MTNQRKLFKPSSVAFCVLLLILCNSFYAFSQQITVTGKVTDKNDGRPIPGVTIKVKGTAAGTMTNSNGVYSLQTAANAILTFTYISYEVLELPAAAKTTLNVQLVPNNQRLDEVVVIGYGTTTKKDATGSVSTLSAVQMRDLPVSC
jgi:hypothetical protein